MLTINSFDVGAHELERIESRSQSGLTGKLKWQLVLEKAYLDYESNHVSSHEDGSPSKGNDQSSTEGERGVLQKCSLPAPQCYVMPEFVPSGCNNAVTVDSAPSQQAIVSTSRLESGGRQVVAVTTSASLRIHGCGKEQAPGTTAPDQQPSTFAHSAEKESLRLIKAGDGVQLSIRSGELDGEAALRLSKEVQRVLAEKGQPLMRVLLNGQSLWDAEGAPHGDYPDSECADYRINKTY